MNLWQGREVTPAGDQSRTPDLALESRGLAGWLSSVSELQPARAGDGGGDSASVCRVSLSSRPEGFTEILTVCLAIWKEREARWEGEPYQAAQGEWSPDAKDRPKDLLGPLPIKEAGILGC